MTIQTKSERLIKRLKRDVQWVPGKHYATQLEEIMDEAAAHIKAQAKAMEVAREALERLALALPKDRSTVKTCYAVNDIDRDNVHSALSTIKEVQ